MAFSSKFVVYDERQPRAKIWYPPLLSYFLDRVLPERTPRPIASFAFEKASRKIPFTDNVAIGNKAASLRHLYIGLRQSTNRPMVII